MKQFLKENSHKYLSTMCQIVGLACSSSFGSKVFEAAKTGNIANLKLSLFSFRFSFILFIMGIILLVLGWYIMLRVDMRKSGVLEYKNA